MSKIAAARLGLVTLVLALCIVSALSPTPADAQPNVAGQWTTLPYQTPVNPIHVALLHNGKVLIIGGSENNENNTIFKNAVWDPATGTFAQQTTPWDLFCNGMSFLPDGRVIITGGNLQYDPFFGPPWTTVFDPATEQFYRLEDMAAGRWYPSTTPLMDGGTMVFGGLDGQGDTNTTVEIYDVAGGWSLPYPSDFTPGWYPRLHLLPNGNVFMAGPYPPSKTFNPSQGTWWTGGHPTNYGDSRLYGSSVLLPMHPDDGYRPRVMIFGGNVTGATNTVEFIDLGTWPEQWVSMPPMSVARVTMNAVLLPDGKILTLGGSTQFNDPVTAHRETETWDPIGQTWTPSGTAAYDRLYHSTALLLPDATVWVAGSNPTREWWEPNMEIYTPPYLFTAAGTPAPRPTITTVPPIAGYGLTIPVVTPDAANIDKVILMRPGSNTHAFDSEQRLLYTYFAKSDGTLLVEMPTNQGAAPPGHYMMFLIDNQGVPSVAKFIQLVVNPANQPPAATITTPSTYVNIQPGETVTFASTASDPDGTIALYTWIFPGGSPAKSNEQNPGPVTFATPGVYTVSLTVLDDLGVNNPSPPTVTVTVGDAAAPAAAITSPANGATVNGMVTVAMTAANVQGSPTQFLLKLDSGLTLSSQSLSTETSASYAWDSSTTSNGTHMLNLTLTDGAGRTATAAITVTVENGPAPDTTAPTVELIAPAAGATVSGTVSVTAAATDDVGVTGVQFKLDGVNLGVEDTTVPYSVTWDSTTVTPGTHTLIAVAKDAAGNTTTSAPIAVTVVAPAPPSTLARTDGNWFLNGASISADLANAIISDAATAAGYGVPWPVPGYPATATSSGAGSIPTGGSAPAATTPSSGGGSVLQNIGGNWVLNGAGISGGLANAIMTDPATAAGYGVAWPVNGGGSATTTAALAPTSSSGGSALQNIGGNWVLNGAAISGALANAIMTDPATAAGYGVAWPVTGGGSVTTTAAPAPASASGGSTLQNIGGNWVLNGAAISGGLANAIMTDPATAAGYGLSWPVVVSGG